MSFRRIAFAAITFLAAFILSAVTGCAPQSVGIARPQSETQRTNNPTFQSPGTPTLVSQLLDLPTPTTRRLNEPTIPLFDAHLHYSREAWAQYPIAAILATLDRAGIKRALVSSTPDEGTLNLYAADPARIVPEVRPYRVTDDVSRWFIEPGIVEYVESELNRPNIPFRGVGEFHIYGDTPKKAPFVKRIIDIAVERNLILHAHSDDVAIVNLFALNPRAKILWAHAGMTTPITTVEKMLDRYPNLYAELALRSDVSSAGKLDPGWRALFLKYPERFLYGTDTWIPSRWEEVVPGVATARSWLAELPRDVAEKISWQNFEALYGR